jgi:low temperature requirement protein LtrA
MFLFVFGVWWGYFDDVPKAGLRPQPVRATGWLLGHLLLQLSLVAAAVGYAKVLGSELGSTLTGDTSLLLTAPLVGVLVGLAVIGVCSRRVPQRQLLVLRLGGAGVVAVMALVTWQAGWISADGGAVILALTAVVYSSLATVALRRTRLQEVA